MSNPLQPKCIKVLEQEFGAYVVNILAASKSGHMDILACINGAFYGFEIKWKSDVPSELQKQKINKLIDAGGKGYFIRSEHQLRSILNSNIPPVKYELKPTVIL